MLSEKEIQFLAYWANNRERQGTVSSKLLRGFPMALLFSLPILLFIILVRVFIPEWYIKISGTSSGTFITATAAVFIITLFYSFFRMHYKWENNEQVYKILKLKEEKSKNENKKADS